MEHPNPKIRKACIEYIRLEDLESINFVIKKT